MSQALPPSKPGRPPAVLCTTAQQTEDQLETLLRTVGILSSWVCEPVGEPGIHGDGAQGVRLADPETRRAVEATIIRATNRMDVILDDPKRWACPAVDARDLAFRHLQLQTASLEQSINANNAAIIQTLRAAGVPMEPPDAAPPSAPAKNPRRRRGGDDSGKPVKK